MNEIPKNFLLTCDKFMLELYCRQPGFTYSVCRLFTKHCERILKFTEIGNLNYIHTNDTDTACFVLDAVNISKDLPTRTVSDKILKDGVYEIALNQQCDGYQRGLASKVYNFSNIF